MCKYLLDLIGFNADEPGDCYDSKTKLSYFIGCYHIAKFLRKKTKTTTKLTYERPINK